MGLWNHFWSFAVTWAPTLMAIGLCGRAAISRDGRARRLAAVAVAFIPALLPLSARLGLWGSHAPGASGGTTFFQTILIAPIVPAGYLLAWAFGSRDDRWLRVACLFLGLLGLCSPLFNGLVLLIR